MADIIEVLNDGFVRLDYYAPKDPELQIVNAARVSYNKRKQIMSKEDEGLINFLMKNRHGTPFEMAEFAFHIRCPIFVTREWHRHRIASYNEMSGRYVQLETKFYTPKDEDIREQVGKQGNYTYQPITDKHKQFGIKSLIKEVYDKATENYDLLLKLGVAKELARIILPVSIYTEFYYKTNARSLMNFISLRSASNAMFEIRQYSIAIENLFAKIMPITYAAFINNGKVAP